MAELKTKVTNASVEKFLAGIKHEERRQGCEAILKLMQGATRAEPKMWGTSIVGFGECHYVYASGREGDWFVAGFSPRKGNITLYSMGGFAQFEDLLKRLGKHTIGKGCLYIKKLEYVNLPTLRKLIQNSVRDAKKLCQQARSTKPQ